MKLKFIPIFLFIVTLQAAHSSGIDSTPPQGKVIYTMNCTFVDDTGKAIGKSQKYILRKGDGREQMEITPQENAHVPPPIYIQKQVVLTPMVGSKPSTEQYSTDDRDQGR